MRRSSAQHMSDQNSILFGTRIGQRNLQKSHIN